MKSILMKSAGVILILILLFSALVGCTNVLGINSVFGLDDELVSTLTDYLANYNTNYDIPGHTLGDKLSLIANGYNPLLVKFGDDCYYAVAYYTPEHDHDETMDYCCSDKYVWIGYKTADAISKTWQGKELVAAFQINNNEFCRDLVTGSIDVKMLHFSLFTPEFSGDKAKTPNIVFDNLFIYITTSNEDCIYYTSAVAYHEPWTIDCVEVNGEYYVLAPTCNSEDSYEKYYREYYDACRLMWLDQIYYTSGFSYHLIPLDDLVELIRKAKNGEHIHNYISDCNDSSHYLICSCGEKIDVEEHSYEWVTDLEATFDAPGYKHKECECGHIIEENTEIPADKSVNTVSEKLIIALARYASGLYAGYDSPKDAFAGRMYDAIDDDKTAIFVKINPDDHYFVCVYGDVEDPSQYVPHEVAFKIDYAKYTWVAYESEEEIQPTYNGMPIITGFQINRPLICYDVVDGDESVSVENITIYRPAFVDGVNVLDPSYIDSCYIYIAHYEDNRFFDSVEEPFHDVGNFSCIELEGEYYVLARTCNSEDSYEQYYREYYDACRLLWLDQIYYTSGFSYHLIPLDDLVELIIKAKNGEHIHNYISDCNDSSHYLICSCGEKIDVEEHSYEWVVDLEATFDAPGYKHKECECGHIIEENTEIPILHEHEFVAEDDIETHFYICSCGEKIDVEEHSYEWVTIQEPTYYVAGIMQCLCTGCGRKIYVDQYIAPEHVHNFVLSADDEIHYYLCDCGVYSAYDYHDYEWIVDLPATETEPGYKHAECKECGYVTRENTMIPTDVKIVDPVEFTGDCQTIFNHLFLFVLSRVSISPNLYNMADSINGLAADKFDVVFLTPDPYDCYFVCAYTNPEHLYYCEACKNNEYYDVCYRPDKYTWIMFENERSILEYLDGEKIVAAFQINRPLVCESAFTDEEVSLVEYFQEYKTEFVNGYNVAQPLIVNQSFIYRCESTDATVYFTDNIITEIDYLDECIKFENEYYYIIEISYRGYTSDKVFDTPDEYLEQNLGEYREQMMGFVIRDKIKIAPTGEYVNYYGLFRFEDIRQLILDVRSES